ncbi:MAG: amidohydrolase family protein [Pirellulales bacterium]|nr:amidohydrolase family protein [Pirellulales bacterium]
MPHFIRLLILALVFMPALSTQAGDVKDTDVYARLKKQLDAVPAIDTHSHLGGPGNMKHFVEHAFRGEQPKDCALRRVWNTSYFTWGHNLAPWPADHRFDTWWTAAQADFNNSRARSAYRAMLPIFQDLYNVDFESLTLEQARELNTRMEKNLMDPDWADEVIRKRANTELIVVDSFVMPRQVRGHHPFAVSACNVRWLINGFHPSEFSRFPAEDPYAFAAQHKMPVESLDDYVAVVDRILAESKKAGAICLKSQTAYDRTLQFDRVAKHRAEEAFGKPRNELKWGQVKAFQDYLFWRLAELSAKHELPFQIHTGHAYIQGSNPMNLVDLIQANRKTKFILFHGGFPWVGETGMIALRCPNVWVDSVWMPVLSYTMGKRAYKEWLDMFSSNRIMWGSDLFTVEGTYGTTMYTRQCITEALAEKVVAKELREEDALRIGRQILRENALEIFPSLRKLTKENKTMSDD